MWSKVVQVAGDDKGRYDRWDSGWRIGVRSESYRGAGDVADRGERRSGGQLLAGRLWGGHLSTWDRA
jgi:hypothetical protein